MVIVAAAQFAPTTDKERNLARITDLTARAVAEGAALVVFPEYSAWFAATLDERYAENAEILDGPFVTGLASIAAEQGVTIVAGMTETPRRADDDRISNALVTLDPQGKLIAEYRKLHLYDAFGSRESDWIRPGDISDPQTFTIDGLRFGLQTCYDLRFPEVTRRLADTGVDVVVVPAEWVAGPLKLDHWKTLIRARAIENTSYLIAADHMPPVGVGASAVIDPVGEVLASVDDGEGVAIASVDRARIQAVRRINPALTLRRFTVVPG